MFMYFIFSQCLNSQVNMHTGSLSDKKVSLMKLDMSVNP